MHQNRNANTKLGQDVKIQMYIKHQACKPLVQALLTKWVSGIRTQSFGKMIRTEKGSVRNCNEKL